MIERYLEVRSATEALAEPLSPEDQQVQSMPSCSPVKWHRAHTTWFFEAFLLGPSGIPSRRPDWHLLFNSYYEALGPRHPRPARGLLTRPTASEVAGWRAEVDRAVVALLERLPPGDPRWATVELGLAHEEQHQELILTDMLHAFSLHPHLPAYRGRASATGRASARPAGWISHPGGLVEIGYAGSAFAFDNEGPRHRAWLEPFALADRLVTIEEWAAFARDGGYRTPALWLSEGWEWVKQHQIEAPMHTWRDGDQVRVFGVDGLRDADPAEPVRHLSYYEADALARFLGARLPTEAEWEAVAAGEPVEGNFREDGWLSPRPAAGRQLYGDVWQWTSSPYVPYPRFRAPEGAVGEYNGKFMINQLVLRGGSCFTPRGHIRPTYRNFWHPDTRFQMTGLRLARDA